MSDGDDVVAQWAEGSVDVWFHKVFESMNPGAPKCVYRHFTFVRDLSMLPGSNSQALTTENASLWPASPRRKRLEWVEWQADVDGMLLEEGWGIDETGLTRYQLKQ
jgi:hypothetical protein